MWSNKKGAIALYLVIFTPIVMMLFSVMLDGILTKNIQHTTQRHLDVSSLAVVVAARADGCAVNELHINEGIALFQKNMNASGTGVEYTITAVRNAPLESIGMVKFLVNAKANNLIGDMFIP